MIQYPVVITGIVEGYGRCRVVFMDQFTHIVERPSADLLGNVGWFQPPDLSIEDGNQLASSLVKAAMLHMLNEDAHEKIRGVEVHTRLGPASNGIRRTDINLDAEVPPESPPPVTRPRPPVDKPF